MEARRLVVLLQQRQVTSNSVCQFRQRRSQLSGPPVYQAEYRLRSRQASFTIRRTELAGLERRTHTDHSFSRAAAILFIAATIFCTAYGTGTMIRFLMVILRLRRRHWPVFPSATKMLMTAKAILYPWPMNLRRMLQFRWHRRAANSQRYHRECRLVRCRLALLCSPSRAAAEANTSAN